MHRWEKGRGVLESWGPNNSKTPLTFINCAKNKWDIKDLVCRIDRTPCRFGATLCTTVWTNPRHLVSFNTCVFNPSFRSSFSTWQVRPILNQWTVAAIMSSQHRRELLLWSTSWLARPTLQFPDVLQRSTDSKLQAGCMSSVWWRSWRRSTLFWMWGKERRVDQRLQLTPETSGESSGVWIKRQLASQASRDQRQGGTLWALPKSSFNCITKQWALFRANKNLKKSLSFIQSRVEYSRSYLRNLVVKINFDRSWELCNNSVNFSAREMFLDTFPLRIQRGI